MGDPAGARLRPDPTRVGSRDPARAGITEISVVATTAGVAESTRGYSVGVRCSSVIDKRAGFVRWLPAM